MPIEKPEKPAELVPRAFGGIKNNFSDDLQSTGFEPNIPQTYNGDNLNYHLDATGKELDYVEKVVDFINQIPVNHIPFVNENNQLDYIDKDEIGGNGSGYNLGDTKITDHILEGDEAEGWALQGTYVSGAFYSDFYNKWLEQYRNSQAITTYTPQDMSFIGSVTNNDWVVGNFSTSNYIKIEKNLLNIASTANSFEIVAKITTGSDVTTTQLVIGQGVSESALGYNLVNIGVNGGHFGGGISYNSGNQGFSGSYAVQPNTTYYLKYEFTSTAQNIYYATEKDNWILDATKASSGNPSASTYDLTIGAWRRNNTTPVRPFLGTVDLKETYIKVNGEDWFIPLETETYYQNANKRRFYPIADKPKYDEMYETYGIADFYGIDEENKRIFLPRNKYFFQLTDDVSKVNNMVEAGLPNIEAFFKGETMLGALTGAFTTSGVTQGDGGNSGTGTNPDSFKMDASLYNPIYGNSDTVQPPSSLKLLYYCVGNTVVNDSEINAGALVAEMEQKANIFLDNTLPSQEFKNQSMLWGLPDYENAIVVKTGANDNTNNFYYTAPSNGLFSAKAFSSGATRATAMIAVNGNQVGANYNIGTSGYNSSASTMAPVSKGDEIAYVVGGTSNVYVQFIPLKGVN